MVKIVAAELSIDDGGRIKFGGNVHVAADDVVSGDVVIMGGSLRVDGVVDGLVVGF